jgi:Cytochrome P460
MRHALLLLLALPLLAQKPQYAPSGELLIPEDYRDWIFVGASLGMGYNEPGAAPTEGQFHHVYLSPEAYQQYKRTGTFPKQAILMMEVYSAASRESINKQGRFSGDFLRVEAAVKDADRFPEGWRYFDFSGPEPKKTSTPFAQDRCWSCHNEHGQTDNVFTQFYPKLRKSE